MDRAKARDQVEYIQRLCGQSGQQAMNVSVELMNDMQRGTFYPPDIKPATMSSDLVLCVDKIISHIDLKKQEAVTDSDKAPVT